jgi:predicted Rossmann fold nucleotide-binding protein DprA/Smf involved in DNA uptake
MVLLEIMYIIIGIIVAAIVAASLMVFRRKDKSNDDDFTKFVRQTAKNLSDIDKVLSYFNDRLDNLEKKLNENKTADDPPEGPAEPEYINTKYYAYEDNGKIVIEIYRDNDVKVILPKQEKQNNEKTESTKTENTEIEPGPETGKAEEIEKTGEKDYRKILLEKLKTPRTWKEITTFGIPNVSLLLIQLKKEGLVKKDENGYYFLAENKKS